VTTSRTTNRALRIPGVLLQVEERLTQFRVELDHLEGPLQLCARCSPGGPVSYWTRDLAEHRVPPGSPS
jgi:hypothetical protein